MQPKCEKTAKAAALSGIATLLDYPTAQYKDNIKQARALVKIVCPRSAKLLDQFAKTVSTETLEQLEEQFTRTFDIAPLCNLYASSYIYGDENFDRGNLMATLSFKFKELGFDSGNELPDHLGLLLKFSTFISTEELNELIRYCLLDPVKQMNDCLKDCSNNPFHLLINAIFDLLKAELPGDMLHD
ncbi:hypothetical protein BH10CYA1_BH10CYA1_13510 [soil metagenome]